jgi:hypothetical protein
MARAMQHPYYGHTVFCDELDGTQHEKTYAWHKYRSDRSECCNYPMLECIDCPGWVSCCACGVCHALECEWPL